MVNSVLGWVDASREEDHKSMNRQRSAIKGVYNGCSFHLIKFQVFPCFTIFHFQSCQQEVRSDPDPWRFFIFVELLSLLSSQSNSQRHSFSTGALWQYHHHFREDWNQRLAGIFWLVWGAYIHRLLSFLTDPNCTPRGVALPQLRVVSSIPFCINESP